MRRILPTFLVLFALALVSLRPASAAAPKHTVTASQAMRAYVAAIRYFNAEITEPEAETIVYCILKDSKAAGIDPRLVVAVVATESAFDSSARSTAGAEGLGQLMPETAALDGVTDSYAIDQNIRGTVMTLVGNLRHYSGFDMQHQYIYAIAAYNAGTGAVDRYGGIPPYDETINYVMKVVVLWRRLVGLSAT